eukprot:5390362-Karenia_brevis.AAC.1
MLVLGKLAGIPCVFTALSGPKCIAGVTALSVHVQRLRRAQYAVEVPRVCIAGVMQMCIWSRAAAPACTKTDMSLVCIAGVMQM